MYSEQRMEKQEIVSVLIKGQWYLMFFACMFLGVFSNVAYLQMKNPSRKRWNGFFDKICLACFVCLITHGAYSYYKLNHDFEYIAIALASFLHWPIGSWMIYTLWPMVSKIIVGSLSGGKKDE